MSTKPSSGWVGGKKASKDNANAKNATTPTRGGSPRGRGGRGRGGGRGASSASGLSRGGKATSTGSTGTSTAPAATAGTNQRVVDMVEISDDDNNTNKSTKSKSSSTNNKRKRSSAAADFDDDAEVGEFGLEESDSEQAEEEAEEEETRKTIPPELLTKLLHEFFENSNTRITRDANDAVAKYLDVFVREAIARAAVERGSGGGGFLEVEDLEKVAPQLLLDL